jgi:hypothetical protein
VYVIFLTSAGGISSLQKISNTAGGFTGVLDNGDMFGNSVTEIRDLDGTASTTSSSARPPTTTSAEPRRGMGAVHEHERHGRVASQDQRASRRSDRASRRRRHVRDLEHRRRAISTVTAFADLIVGAWLRRRRRHEPRRGYVLFLDGVPGAFCGDGILDPGEDCDDSNTTRATAARQAVHFEVERQPVPERHGVRRRRDV